MTDRREQLRAVVLAAIMVTSMVAMGATALAGSAAASDDVEAQSLDIDASFNVDDDEAALIAGSDNQELPRLDVDVEADAMIVPETEITLPDGVTFNETTTAAEIRLPGLGVPDTDEDISFSDDGQTLIIEDHDLLDDGDTFRIRGVFVSADTDIDSEFGGASADIEIESGGGATDEDLLKLYNSGLNTENGESTVPADGTSGIDAALNVETPDVETEDFTNLQIANETDLIIETDEEASITFSDDFDANDLSVDTENGDGGLDVSNAEIEGDSQLVIPVNETFDHDTNVLIESDNEADIFAAAPDADDESTLSMSYEATNSTGVVEVDSDYEIKVENPDLDIFDDGEADSQTLVSGVDDQEAITNVDTGISAVGNVPALVSATGDEQIETGTNITIVANSTDVTFSSANEDLEVAVVNTDDHGSSGVVNDDDDLFDIQADENELTFEVEDVGGIDDDLDEDQGFAIGNVNNPLQFNVSSDAPADEVVGFELLTGEAQEVNSEPENDNTLDTDRVDVDLDYVDTEDVLLDDAESLGYPVGVDIVVPAGEDDGAAVVNANTNITVAIEDEDAGVTFDTRHSFAPDESGEAIEVEEGDIVVEDTSITYPVDATINVQDGDEETFSVANIEESGLNLTADPSEVDISVTTNSSTQETTNSDTLGTQELDADMIGAEDTDNLPSDFDDLENVDVTAGEEDTLHVFVANDSEDMDAPLPDEEFWPYGGTTVDLEVVDAPDGVDTDGLLNTTQIETDGLDRAEADGTGLVWGDAAFEFEAATVTGDYTVNATTSNDMTTQIEIEVSAGDADAFEVEHEANAFRGGSFDGMSAINNDNEVEAGIYNVSVVDEFGSLVEDDEEFTFDAVSDDVSLIGFANEYDDDNGVPDGAINADLGDTISANVDLSVEDGHFYAFATSGTSGVHDANLEIRGISPTADIDSDDADVTFYSGADDATIELEDELINVDANTTVEATAVTEDDGEDVQIEMPRLYADFDIDNTSVAEFEDDTDDRTGDLGVANVTIEGLDVGETEVDVDFTSDRTGVDATTTLEVSEEEFEITAFDDVTATEGFNATAVIDVENTADVEGTQEVDVSVDDEDIDIEASEDVTIDAGVTETVSLELVTEELDVGEYNLTAATEDDTANATLTVEEPEDVFELSNLVPETAEVEIGEEFDVSADVENTGEAAGNQEVELRLSPDGEAVATQDVALDPDESTTVTFEDVSVDEPGDYEHTIATDQDTISGDLTVLEDPFFEVDDLFPLDAEIVEGDTVAEINATVENTGEVEDTQEITLTVTNETGDVVLEATLEDELTLEGGESAEVNLTDVDTSELEPGVYTHEIASEDDSAESSLTVLEDAFFDVSDLDPEDATVEVGEEFDVSALINNTGEVVDTQEIELLLDDDVVATQNVTLEGGANETVTFEDVSVDEAGDYEHTVASEDANVTGSLTVEEEPEAELEITEFDDVTIEEGDEADIEVEIENVGGADATDATIELDIDDGEITVEEDVDVDAGDTVTVEFEEVGTDDLDADEYDMEADADGDDTATATLTVEEEDGIPGFTAGIAALALLGAALLALRLRNEE